MRIESVDITSLAGIDHLKLDFDKRANIICGPNGVGKSTVLDAIAHSFSGGQSLLKRNVNAEFGQVVTAFSLDGTQKKASHRVSEFIPDKYETNFPPTLPSERLIYFKTNRTFDYEQLSAVGRDQNKELHLLWEELKRGVYPHGTKNWFVNRYLYSAYKEAVNDTQRGNHQKAKDAFSALDGDFSFSRVDAATNEIMVNTPYGEVYFEYLSAGFKSCLSIMFSIIREVEFRFGHMQIPVSEFTGVVLIDEIELHLHPIWQSKILSVLLEFFPQIQFIVTTHSPHVIQAADPNQIKVLQRVHGTVTEREIPTSSYGFKGWTLDEVLTDVMGMEDTRSSAFVEMMTAFQSAVESEDYQTALGVFEQLDASLHPNSRERKLLRLQLAGLRGGTI